ncbi:unnamed protein product [Euphydryas editha]|uniref:Uncharacterized protein n=1 Tax=Euphydryas editha TaxID=104508 RepID=A0AAU9TRP5_EUPED|nr:unnamed protein product [Euphydryas editha]
MSCYFIKSDDGYTKFILQFTRGKNETPTDLNMISQKLNKLAYINFSSEKHAKANCEVTTIIWRNELMFTKKDHDKAYTRGVDLSAERCNLSSILNISEPRKAYRPEYPPTKDNKPLDKFRVNKMLAYYRSYK